MNDDAGEDKILRPVVYSLDVLLLFVGLVNLVATLLLTPASASATSACWAPSA